MIDWLLDIGNKYLNKEVVTYACMGMLFLLFFPVLLLLLSMFGVKNGVDLSIVGQVSDLLYDLCFATACLALMTLVYADGNKVPVIGYFVVTTVIKGAYQFFITSIGAKGELYTLIFVLCFVLHITVGVQLLKTRFSVFGKAMLCYIGGLAVAAGLRASALDAVSSVVILITGFLLAFTFYKELPLYYK